MSISSSFTSDKAGGMDMGLEMQERSRSLWPHVNGTGDMDHNLAPPPPAAPPQGTAHHNLPPIAAITSCRPSTSLALKVTPTTALAAATVAPPMPGHAFTPPIPATAPSPKPLINNSPCPSPSSASPSPRDRRDEHIFALPNPPRSLQPVTRAPTPFPDIHSHQNPHTFHVSSIGPEPPPPPGASKPGNNTRLSNVSPVQFSIPSQSAFATVPRPQPLRFNAPQTLQDSSAVEPKLPAASEPTCNAVDAVNPAPASLSAAAPRDPSPIQCLPPSNPDSSGPREGAGQSSPVKSDLSNMPIESPAAAMLIHSNSHGATTNLPPTPVQNTQAALNTEKFTTCPVPERNEPYARFERPPNINDSEGRPVGLSPKSAPLAIPMEAASTIENRLNDAELSNIPGNKSPNQGLPQDSSEIFNPSDDKTHQHLTSDGRKSYSNQNRRYLATPGVGDGPPQQLFTAPIKDPYEVHGPLTINTSSMRASDPKMSPHQRAHPNNPMERGVVPNSRFPDNFLGRSDAVRGMSRPSPSSAQNSPTVSTADMIVRSYNPSASHYMRQSPSAPSPNSALRGYPDHNRQYPPNHDQKQFPPTSSSHDQYRSPSNQPNPQHRMDASHLPPHFQNANVSNPPPLASPHSQLERMQPSQHVEMRHYPSSNHERTPSSHAYLASRDIPHSAHSERPLAFSVTGALGGELPRSMPTQAEMISSSGSKNRPEHPSSEYSQNRGYPHPHVQKPFEAPLASHSTAPISQLPPSNRHPGSYERAPGLPPPTHQDKSYPAHSAFGLNDFARTFQQQQQHRETFSNAPTMHKNFSSNTPGSASQQQLVANANKYQAMPQRGYPAYSTASGLSMIPVGAKKPEPPQSTPQHSYPSSRPGASHLASMQGPMTQYSLSQNPHAPQYPRQSDGGKPVWSPPVSSSHRPEASHSIRPMHRPTEPIKQVQLPQDLAQLHRTQMAYPPGNLAPQSPKERAHHQQSVAMSPRGAPAPVVTVSSTISSRVSSQSHQSSPRHYPARPPYANPSSQYPPGDPMGSSPHYFSPNRSLPSSVSSTSSPSLPRMNFAPGHSAFNPNHTDPHNSYMPPSSNHNTVASRSHHQRLPGFHETTKNLPPMQSSSRQQPYPTSQNYSYPQHGGSGGAPSTNSANLRHQVVKDPSGRTISSPYAPSRGHAMENDTCRNPFELPVPSSVRSIPTSSAAPSVIKSHYSPATGGHSDPKSGGYPPRPQFDAYPPRLDSMKKPINDVTMMPSSSRYPMPSPRTQQRSVSGSDDRQKPPQLSARFPPVPQSNFDLQRQIHDRMTGVQQAPPRLIEKARMAEKQSQPPPRPEIGPPPLRHKRESPLDLSVKTVRQSADSTKDDVDLFAMKYQGIESRLASAPKIDFNPNFAGPLVHTEAQPLPPVQSIRAFSSPSQAIVGNMQESTFIRKRPAEDRSSLIPPKIPKVDTWKLAMDEQIEERLKAARQSRHPAAPLTPLHPPAQSVTPTNPEVLQPPARPHPDVYSPSHREHFNEPQHGRGWSSGVFQPPVRPPDPDRIVEQISQGVLPVDSRLLQDHSVMDKIVSSIEEKEARLQALQAAAMRGRQPLPSFDALGAEIMRTPPSYPQPPLRGSEPVPIGIEANQKFMQGQAPPRGQENDLDGLAAFLAARIRTKAEMKQMGPTDAFRPPGSHGMRPIVPGTSPPKSLREGRLSQGSQGSRRQLMSPGSEDSTSVTSAKLRDPSGIRSSSETSVFDFRESDSEGEAPGIEKATLEGMRRPRKTVPRTKTQGEVSEIPSEPRMPRELLKPDPAWEEACDMFVEQLRNRPVKRSIRKKKPNPKFFANDSETPPFMKIKTEDLEEQNSVPVSSEVPKASVKIETELKSEEKAMPPLPDVKDESSSEDDLLLGVTQVKHGRVKIITKKQRQQASDSEWGSSIENSSNSSSLASSSESESDEDSEDSTARKVVRRGRARDSSDSDEVGSRRGGRIKTRNQLLSDSDGSGSTAVRKKRRTRKTAVSDSDDSSGKTTRRTRSRAVSDSEDDRPKSKRKLRMASESDDEKDKKSTGKKGGRIQTRQQARINPPARMKLRSKRRGRGNRGALEDDLIKFKKRLRIPEKLIGSTRSKKTKDATSDEEGAADLDGSGDQSEKNLKGDKKSPTNKSGLKSRKSVKKDESEDTNSDESRPRKSKDKRGVVTRGTSDMMQKRSLRGSVGVRRSNKAVQNSKRHLNKSKKRSKMRRKFRSGFDYIRKNKKKPGPKKDDRATPTITEHKRRDRAEITDISVELKSWVVNKSAGETLLHRAARQGYHEGVAYCLESLRMPPSTKDNAGYTPLHEACTRGHVATAELLLQYGASASESAPGGVRPLHQAVEHNHIELVRLLLSYGADPMLATYTGQTGLSLASSDQIRDLIQRHMAEVISDDPPKWHFERTPAVYDTKWTADPLSEPPSPSGSPYEVEVEASRAMLPQLYRLNAAEGELFDPQERWVLLSDIVAFLKVSSGESVIEKLPNTIRREMADKVFVERAVACNILSSTKPTGRKVTLLRYDDSVRQLLDVEVTTVTHIDR